MRGKMNEQSPASWQKREGNQRYLQREKEEEEVVVEDEEKKKELRMIIVLRLILEKRARTSRSILKMVIIQGRYALGPKLYVILSFIALVIVKTLRVLYSWG